MCVPALSRIGEFHDGGAAACDYDNLADAVPTPPRVPTYKLLVACHGLITFAALASARRRSCASSGFDVCGVRVERIDPCWGEGVAVDSVAALWEHECADELRCLRARAVQNRVKRVFAEQNDAVVAALDAAGIVGHAEEPKEKYWVCGRDAKRRATVALEAQSKQMRGVPSTCMTRRKSPRQARPHQPSIALFVDLTHDLEEDARQLAARSKRTEFSATFPAEWPKDAVLLCLKMRRDHGMTGIIGSWRGVDFNVDRKLGAIRPVAVQC